MNMSCLRPRFHLASSDESEPYMTTPPGDFDDDPFDDVFEQETEFGHLRKTSTSTSTNKSSKYPVSRKITIKGRPSRSSRRSLRPCSLRSSLDVEVPRWSPSRSLHHSPSSFSLILRRSLSSFLGRPLTEPIMPDDPSTSPITLEEMRDGVLHVYRTAQPPPEGLHFFRKKVAALASRGSNWYDRMATWWRADVADAGSQTLAVGVASPKHCDHISALVRTWRTFYREVLPILEAMLLPIKGLRVRYDALASFRDIVLPYVDVVTLCTNQRDVVHHRAALLHLTHVLARVDRCHLQSSSPGLHHSSSFSHYYSSSHCHEEDIKIEDNNSPLKHSFCTSPKSRASTLEMLTSLLLETEMTWLGKEGNHVEALIHLQHGHIPSRRILGLPLHSSFSCRNNAEDDIPDSPFFEKPELNLLPIESSPLSPHHFWSSDFEFFSSNPTESLPSLKAYARRQ
ncbi:uncharacterized protein LOC143023826 [Oratosquilla oratoria]|uniref:uncharacterized protein LOC143023826 n=1 Tax=Oratosquilla oratoria TaxID=337810 RepID=UPI003F757ED0